MSMVRSIPLVFNGTATLTPEKIAILKQWYAYNLIDADKATELIDATVYKACANTLEDVLNILYEVQEELVEKTVKSRHFGRKLIALTAVVGLIYIVDRQLQRDAEAKKIQANTFFENSNKAGTEA